MQAEALPPNSPIRLSACPRAPHPPTHPPAHTYTCTPFPPPLPAPLPPSPAPRSDEDFINPVQQALAAGFDVTLVTHDSASEALLAQGYARPPLLWSAFLRQASGEADVVLPYGGEAGRAAVSVVRRQGSLLSGSVVAWHCCPSHGVVRLIGSCRVIRRIGVVEAVRRGSGPAKGSAARPGVAGFAGWLEAPARLLAMGAVGVASPPCRAAAPDLT